MATPELTDRFTVEQRNELLSESTLEAWDRRDDASITDQKFSFVDHYIRFRSLTDTSKEVMGLLRQHRFREIVRGLELVYDTKNSQYADDSPLVFSWRNSIVSSEIGRQTIFAMRIEDTYRLAASVTCLYVSKSAFGSVKECAPKDLRFVEGVLLKTNLGLLEESEDGVVRRGYLVKLFHSEFRGLPDLGYSDGEIFSVELRDSSPHMFPIFLVLKDPRSCLQDAWQLPDNPSRLTSVRTAGAAKYGRANSEYLSFLAPTGYKSINLAVEPSIETNLRFLFDKFYRGYV